MARGVKYREWLDISLSRLQFPHPLEEVRVADTHAAALSTGLRVTGGCLRGRRFRVPRGGARPTADRVREALFGRMGDLEGKSVLDLYAGSGALGIEAVSRGAARVVAIEQSAGSLAVLRKNLLALELEDVVQVVPGDVPRSIKRLERAHERFDLALLDPPYASGEPLRALEALVRSTILAPEAMVVLERGRRHPLPRVDGLVPLDERRYGDTVIARFVAKRFKIV